MVHHPYCLKHSGEDPEGQASEEQGEEDGEEDSPAYNHPERPQRVVAILDHLQKTGLLSQCELLTDFGPCSEDLVTLVHDKDYFDKVELT